MYSFLTDFIFGWLTGNPFVCSCPERDNHPAGISQVQEILAPKVRAGPLADAVDVVTVTTEEAHAAGQGLVSGIRMQGAKFVPLQPESGRARLGGKKHR